MTVIIAEAGVNHNGDEQLAMRLVEAAAKAGADIVKFQTFKASKLATDCAQQATYQKKNTGRSESQQAMLSRLELSAGAHKRLFEKCGSLGVEFLSTAFDSESLSFLVDVIGVRRLKIPSGELTNLPFVLEHAKTGLDIIVSTGMANLSEIEAALAVIAFGYTCDSHEVVPSQAAFENAYASAEGQKALKEKVTILHCTTEYPAPPDEINLRAISTLREAFGLKTGYSDHSQGNAVSIAAAAIGACLIEKHFTLDCSMEGPDHQASLEPKELSELIAGIRVVEKAMGNGIKRPMPSEIPNKYVARKSLVALAPIRKGEVFSEENLGCKRPGRGLSPALFWSYVGQEATSNYDEGDLIV